MGSLDRIKQSEENILYKKRGKKYIRVSDPYAYTGLREGWWLINVTSGCTSIREYVFEKSPELKAGILDTTDKICKIISKASEFKPKKELSEEATKDWQKLIDKYGDEFNTLTGPCIQYIAEEIIKELKK